MNPDMLLMVAYMCIIGAAIGSFSGLIPGIHINTLAALMLAFHDDLESIVECVVPEGYAPMMLSCCILSAAVVHSAADFVPSVFFGVPDADNVLNILPGHRMLLEGHAMTAVRCAAIGSLVGSFASVVLAVPMYILLSGGLGQYLDSLTVGVLVSVICLMIVKEGKGGRIASMCLIAATGAIGCAVMNWDIPFDNVFGMEPEAMFPMLSGLFGIPPLLVSLPSGRIPEQTDDDRFPVGPIPGLKGVLTGSVSGWFPGITAASGATIAGCVFGEEDRRGYISMVSSIGSSSTMFTFITLAVSGKERSGTMGVIDSILGGGSIGLGSDLFLCMMATMAISSVLAYVVMTGSGSLMCRLVERTDIRRTNAAILAMMVILTAALTGYCGLLLLCLCTLVGMVPIVLGTNRIHLTGCLIVPVLMFRIGLM
ncbi:MAG: tripartite tricarboxylate transporter permease [Candidatus Methanomethylophilaceae archaeon]